MEWTKDSKGARPETRLDQTRRSEQDQTRPDETTQELTRQDRT